MLLFVIGGGVSAAGKLLVGPARREFQHARTGRGFRPESEIVLAAAGPEAGLFGAADLARRRGDSVQFAPGNGGWAVVAWCNRGNCSRLRICSDRATRA